MSLDEIPLSTSAHLADTQHLSLPQHGAYLLILMTMWRAGGWIVDDERKLANICKTSVKKWRQIAPDIRSLLLVRDGRLSQKRLLSEIEKVLKTVAVNKRNGSAGGKAKSLKNKVSKVATATVSLGVCQPTATTPPDSALLLTSLAKDSELSEENKNQKRKKVRAESKLKGERLPPDWKPKPAHYAKGLERGFPTEVIDSFADKMRNWAVANDHRPVTRKSNWDAAFSNWIDDKSERNGAPNGRANGRPQKIDPIAAAAARRFGGGRRNGAAPGTADPVSSTDRMGDQRHGSSGGGQPAFDLDLKPGPDGVFRR